jgi:nuclear pore complex protein Nup62
MIPLLASTFNLFGGGTTNKDAEKKDGPFMYYVADELILNLFWCLAEKKPATLAVPTLGLSTAPTSTPAPATGVAASAGTAGTVSTQVSVPPPSMLRGRSIEDIVNKWTQELETQVKEFERFAREVAVWDRNLIDSGNNVCMSFVILSGYWLTKCHDADSCLLSMRRFWLPSVNRLMSISRLIT